MAMPVPSPKTLLTGATGYIGGTILSQLLSSTNSSPKNLDLTLLIRGADRAEKLQNAYGPRVKCILFTDLSETSFIQELCSQHDIVINAGTGFHPSSTESMVRGLAERQKETGYRTWMIHTSGCTNIGDKPLTGESFPDREFTDEDPITTYNYEKEENEKHWYAQRAAELCALDTGEETGVGVVSLQSPCIFGEGEGLFNTAGLVVPGIMRFVVENGFAFRLGDGSSVIDYVHVVDLAELYLLVLRNIVEGGGNDVPTGKKGIMFPTNGRTKWTDIGMKCLDVTFERGVLPREGTPGKKVIVEIGLEDAAKSTAGDLYIAEVGMAGHRLTKGIVARERFGWRPKRGEREWEEGFGYELEAYLEGRRGKTMANCIAKEAAL